MENNENQSSLAALLFVLRRRMLAVLTIAIASALVFALITAFFIPPVYSSTAKFYVNNDSSNSQTTSSQDINASKSLAESSIVIVRNSTELLKKIIKESGVDITVKELRNSMVTGTYSGTEAFYIAVETNSAKDSHKLATAFYSIIPEALPQHIKSIEIATFDKPLETKEPVSPNLVLNTLIGGFIGFAIAFLIFFLREVLDNTIYTDEDIKDKMGYPIIGVIPTIVTEAVEKQPSGIKLTRSAGK